MDLWKGQKTNYAHYKRDGIFLKVDKTPLGGVHCYSSQDTILTGQLKYLPFYLQVLRRVPTAHTLLGELWVPGQPASYVKSAIKKKEPLIFSVFSVPTLRAEMTLEQLRSLCEVWGLSFCPFARITRERTAKKMIDWFMEERPVDVEGFVFKDSNVSEELKWKPVFTLEATVVGFTEGKKANVGLVGSFVCSIEGHVIADVGGMSKKERILVSDKPEDYLGKVCEIRYQYVGSKGRLRHPAFIRWRDDKRSEQCKLSQDPKLEKYYNDRTKT